MDVKGGQTTTSTPVGAVSAPQNASVSEGHLYIFQLPAMSTTSIFRDDDDAWEILALEQFERGSTAGRDPVDSLREPELLDRPHGIAAADDCMGVRPGDGLSDRLRPGRK